MSGEEKLKNILNLDTSFKQINDYYEIIDSKVFFTLIYFPKPKISKNKHSNKCVEWINKINMTILPSTFRGAFFKKVECPNKKQYSPKHHRTSTII